MPRSNICTLFHPARAFAAKRLKREKLQKSQNWKEPPLRLLLQVFLGIPYATPPIRSNRFSPTRTPLPWDGVKMADTMMPVCPQRLPDIANETASLERMPKGRLEYLRRLYTLLQNQSEDCLYLNVYAPAQGEFANEKLLRKLWPNIFCLGLSIIL
jgi:hypothetical protein